MKKVFSSKKSILKMAVAGMFMFAMALNISTIVLPKSAEKVSLATLSNQNAQGEPGDPGYDSIWFWIDDCDDNTIVCVQ